MEKLAWLLPQFDDFESQPFEIQLSAVFVAFLLIITAVFLLKFTYSFFKASERVSWFNKTLKEVSTQNVAAKRIDLQSAAQQESRINHVGHLWQEFDETLIEVRKDGKTHLYNTFDSNHFFNSSTLAEGVTDNRLIAAVPGFLTAIGVIGTFVGLQIGLSEMNISSDVTLDEMKTGISTVIGGAKVAFMTSVWGVTLSVTFNFIEKILELKIRTKIHKLQDHIDNIFPRLSPEDQLQTIAENSSESRESLQGLAEQIGVKMQESMLTATKGISEALETTLNEIMAPAISKLVDETSEGNQKALEDLLTKFMDGFGGQGEQQRAAMESTSQQVNNSITSMSQTMEKFISTMENQLGSLQTAFNENQVRAASREQQLATNIGGQITSLTESISAQSNVLTDFVQQQMDSLNNTFETRETLAAQRAEQRDTALTNQTNAISTSTQQLVSEINSSIQQQQASSEQILQQGQSLQQSIESTVLASTQATNSMLQSASELNSAAESMRLFGSHVRDAGNQLSGAVTNAVTTTSDLAIQNQNSSTQMETLRRQLLNDTAKFGKLSDQINNMILNAGNTFSELSTSQEKYLTSLRDNVSKLSEQMTQLLSDYAQQANGQTANHLKVWSESTTNYATQMNTAAQALSSVVDEIQDKVGR